LYFYTLSVQKLRKELFYFRRMAKAAKHKFQIFSIPDLCSDAIKAA